MVNSRQQKNQNSLYAFLNRYFNGLVAAILLIFLGLVYLIVLGPKFSATQLAISANNDRGKNLYESSLRKLASYKAMDEVYRKIDKVDLQRFNSVLPDNYVAERLFGEIEEIVSQGGWIMGGLRIINPEETTNIQAEGEGSAATALFTPTDPKIGRYNLELTVAALDYRGLKKLLGILENNLRLLDIVSVNYSAADASATFLLNTYYYKTAL